MTRQAEEEIDRWREKVNGCMERGIKKTKKINEQRKRNILINREGQETEK